MSSTDFTANLGLPYLLSHQAQKHVTLNESLRALDGVLHISVRDRDLNAPPSNPVEGNRYLVGDTATGDWAGHDGELSLFADGGWLFFVPQTGWQIWVEDEAQFLIYDGQNWRAVPIEELQNLALLGVGATADANNPILAKLNATLFTADEVQNGGSGDLYFKLNKETTGDALSVLFQSGFSSRAEIGLIGEDDLVFKVSPDGSQFFEGLRIQANSGQVQFPSGAAGVREQLAGNRTYYVRTDGSDANDGLSNTAQGAFLTYEKAVAAALAIDHSIFEVTLEFGIGTFPITTPEISASSDFKINVRGQGYDQTILNGKLHVQDGVIASVRDLHATGTGENASLRAETGATLNILGTVKVSAGTHAHVIASSNGTIYLTGGKIRVGAGGVSVLATTTGGYIQCWPGERIITDAPASFSNAVVRASDCGVITWQSTTVTETDGAISGRRYNANTNGVIQTFGGGASAIPGTTAGTETNGGVYA